MISQLRPLAALCLALLAVNVSSGKQGAGDDTTAPATTNVAVTVDVYSNRHLISPYVYGGAYPKDAATITDSGLSLVRWGGNSTSRYNWKLHTNNAANDWYYEDFGYSEIGDADSAKYIQEAKERRKTKQKPPSGTRRRQTQVTRTVWPSSVLATQKALGYQSTVTRRSPGRSPPRIKAANEARTSLPNSS